MEEEVGSPGSLRGSKGAWSARRQEVRQSLISMYVVI